VKPLLIAHYDAPHQFEPLLPGANVLGPLLEQASDLIRAATALGASAPASTHRDLRTLLRSMNSYYTNRIEGEHTRPSDIERALQQDFSANADLARRQRLAVSHIHTEALCEAHLKQHAQQGLDVQRWLYDTPALTWLHQQLFEGLPAADLKLADGTLLKPGALRTRAVAVGRHEAPLAKSVPLFLSRWSDVYGAARRGEAAVVAAAASHHRLAWIHPFLDGNGRVARLHTHLLFQAMGMSQGLWSPLRGFARSEPRYKALLQAADEHRRSDLDGRGNLTQAGLVDWIAYVLEVCTDQARFMATLLDVHSMRDRIAAALAFEASTLKSGVRPEALIPLHYLFMSQTELSRADFKAMTGLGDRVATQAVSALVSQGFVATDSAYGALRFAIPRRALRFYFPALWPEAEQDEAMEPSGPSPAQSKLNKTTAKR
jgi:Fic family protein